jgi:hypothetical protein
MKTDRTHDTIHGTIALHVMINHISAGSLATATRRGSFIVNDVPANFNIMADEHILATVFANLLNALITHTDNSCIRISAQLHGRVVMLSLKETHTVTAPNFTGSLREAQQLVERMGGNIVVTTDRNQATTIVLSFLNRLEIAA